MGQVQIQQSIYTESMAKSTFIRTIMSGKEMIGVNNNAAVLIYRSRYKYRIPDRLKEEKAKFKGSCSRDDHNYDQAHRILEETAMAIANLIDMCNTHASTNGGSLNGEWPWLVLFLFNAGMKKIRDKFNAQVVDVLDASRRSKGNGPLLWDSTPPPPDPPNVPESLFSPIVLDLDGDGVETVSQEKGVYFDHDGNRFAEKTGWVGSDDAFLVHDRNGDGKIDGGHELFGNNYTLANGKKAANGFEALAEFDSNGDGVVDRNDERWGELRLWQDKNGNGVVDEGELMTMEEAGVAGLNIHYNEQKIIDENGNEHRQSGSFIREDGSTGEMNDVWFLRNTADTKYLDEIEINDEIIKLPNIRGYGNIPDLHQSMALDPNGALQLVVEKFLTASNPITAKTMIWDIIFAWTKVTDVAPGSRGSYVDAQKLAAMEKLTGQDWRSIWCSGRLDPNPHHKDEAILKNWFADWEQKVTSYFMLSTHYNNFYKLASQAANELEGYSGETPSLKQLYNALKKLYCSGKDSDRLIVHDFLAMLNAYDACGVKCSNALETIYGNIVSTNEFEVMLASLTKQLIVGGESNDILRVVDDKHALLDGGEGDDRLHGGAGNDILDGGAGNDYLEGGAGDDTYVFGKGYGHDTINASGKSHEGERDIVCLVGLTRNDVEFLSRSANNGYHHFIIRIKETGETLTITHGIFNNITAYNDYGIAAIKFGDGSVMEWEEIKQSGFLIEGTDGNNVLSSSNYDSVIHGGAGNDVLYGGAGNDILYGGEGDDRLHGGAGNDILDGGAGNDYLEGGAGDDTYVFGKGYGHDTINASGKSHEGERDIVCLVGLTRNDVEFLSRSANNGYHHFIIRIKETGETLTITHGIFNNITAYNDYGIAAIKFGDGSVMEWEEIKQSGFLIEGTDGNNVLSSSNYDSVIHGGAGNDVLYGGAGNDILYGGEGDDRLHGGAGNDILDGGAGNDYLEGGAGDDTYVFGKGYGHDTINASGKSHEGERDIVCLVGLTRNDVEFLSRSANNGYHHFIIRIKETGETLTITHGIFNNITAYNDYGIAAIKFGDGSVMEWEEIKQSGFLIEGTDGNNVLSSSNYDSVIHGGAGNDVLYGGAGNDILYGGEGDDRLHGGAGNDILDGGAGNDYLEGGAGDDTYVFGKGYGHDTINASGKSHEGERDIVCLVGLTRNDVEFLSRSANNGYHHFIIRIKETGETLTITHGIFNNITAYNDYGIAAIKFGDGSVMEWEEIKQSGFLIEGTDGNNVLSSSNYDSVIHGGAGNDVLYGGAGNDILYGGEGDDRLHGGAGNDILYGGAGNDYLEGGAGDDTYVFGKGYGHDTINASGKSHEGERDIVCLVGLTRNDVEFLSRSANNGYHHFIIRIKETGETLTITHGISNNRTAYNDYGIAAIKFGDGSVMEWEEIKQSGFLIEGTDGNDVLSSSNYDSVIHGGAGNDRLYSGAGNDILYGGEGDDTLYGGAGNDILYGGAGNDYLEGGAGDDTYIMRRGDGQDVINNYGGGNDLLNFININPIDLWFKRAGDNLEIQTIGSSDKVTISNWFYKGLGTYSIDTIQAGNWSITETQVAQMVQALAAFGAPAGSDGGWSDDQKDALNTILSTYWKQASA